MHRKLSLAYVAYVGIVAAPRSNKRNTKATYYLLTVPAMSDWTTALMESIANFRLLPGTPSVVRSHASSKMCRTLHSITHTLCFQVAPFISRACCASLSRSISPPICACTVLHTAAPASFCTRACSLRAGEFYRGKL